jgi:oligopeptide/dipeptide ABC transporter ATP-binding protein
VVPLFAAPRHPYTQGLLASILSPRSRAHSLFSIPGSVPIAGHWPTGCRFHPRCPIARPGLCDVIEPQLETRDVAADRCHLSNEPIAAHAWEHDVAMVLP